MAEYSTLARPYAKAVFEFALEHNALKAWSDSLALLACVVADAQVEALLDNPRLTSEARAQLLIDICAEHISEPVQNLLHLLAQNNKLAVLPAIAERFELLKAEHEKTVEVSITSAVELSDAHKQALSSKLKQRLGCDVTLECSVEKEILGGVIVHANDLVIDASVRGRLNHLAKQLSH